MRGKNLISIMFFLFFALMSVPVHELTHKFDYRNVETSNEKICLFIGCSSEISTRLGYYYFEYSRSDETELEIIDEYTEIHAYNTSLIFLFICVIIFLYLLVKFQEEKK